MKRANVDTMQRNRESAKQRILNAWYCQGGEWFEAGKVAHHIKLTRECAAMYLAQMKQDGFLTSEKRGGSLYYRRAPVNWMRRPFPGTPKNTIPLGRYFP